MTKIDSSIILAILGCGIVTWLPRILPFLFNKKITFSHKAKKFMSFIPMCILIALFTQNLLIVESGKMTGINLENLVVSLPTFIVGFITKSLMWTVIVGVVTMGVIRYLNIF
ncbi:MAG: AzlD domain-containing protein [Vagococcus sp.]|uniref:AzlD domain-containing protein n=1 Tax=Vagococcus sp. TaxID=1933889 RepID=UPI002FC67BF2